MPRRWGPLVLVLVIQLAILAAIPMRRVQARISGTPVTLRTAPVDPYDVLSGYYVTLAYEAVRQGETAASARDARWLVVRRAEPAWEHVAVTAERPATLGADEVAIRLVPPERPRDCRIPSACRFYIPEARREQVDAALRASGGRGLVEMRVDGEGDVALTAFRVGELRIAE